jgi:putative ABC transport system permease protein
MAMPRLRRFLLRLVNVFRRDHPEEDLAREMAAHLALLEERFRRDGMTADQAHDAARRAFGGVEQAKEVQRDARSFAWLNDAQRDIGYASRTLRRTPGFTAIAVLTLALGVGSVTVIYSLVRNVLLDPFPYRDSDRMVDVYLVDASGRSIRGALPAAEFLDYQEQSTVFEDVLGTIVEPMNGVLSTSAEQLSVAWVTPNAFSFLGVAPLLGRVFGPADAAPGVPGVAVLNHRTWVTRFGADPALLGHTVVLDGEPRTIIGIMPPRFEWNVADLWVPAALDRMGPTVRRNSRWFQAHLRPGVSIAEAKAELAVIAARRATAQPKDYPERSRVQVITVIDFVVGQFRGVLYTLFAAVGLLLVIACCNVANMLLARATVREREIAVRAALGASRGRIIRQLLAESLTLALGGVAAGCLLAYGGIKVLAAYLPRQGVPWETQLRLDTPVLLFAVVTAGVSTLAFGLFPAFQTARRELIAGANIGGRGGTAGRQQTRMRNGLIVAEIALSMILLLGAGLLMRTFMNLVHVDLAFDPTNVLMAPVFFAPGESSSPDRRQTFYREALERLHMVPGVVAGAVSSGLPPFGGYRSAVEAGGNTTAEAPAVVQFCSEGYVQALGLRVVQGNSLSATDVRQARKVIVVNETFVRRHLGGTGIVARSVRLPGLSEPPLSIANPVFDVIGVVQDVPNQGIRQPVLPQVYLPYTLSARPVFFVVRTSSDPMRSLNAIREQFRSIDPGVPLSNPETLEAALQESFYAQPRFNVFVLGMFACSGLVLVALGVYGVMAYTVSQQTRDIAIRMALGAERRDVLRMVFRRGLAPLGLGVAIGLAASLGTNRLLINQLWNTTPYDPLTLAAAVMVLILIGTLACWIPARRAVRVEPLVALRHE